MSPTALGVVGSARVVAAGGGWTPANLGPHIWLDANDDASFTYSSGTTVSAWADKSGGARHLSIGSAERTGTINGKKVVNFPGTNGLRTNGLSGLTAPYTLLLVARNGTAAGTQRDAAMFVSDGRIYMPSGGNISAYQGATIDTGVSWGTTSPRNVGVIFNAGNSYMALEANTWGTVKNVGSTPVNPTNFALGAMNGGGSEYWIGDICEVVVIPRAITDAELAQWTAYCATKWGTAAPPAAITDPTTIPNCSLWLDANDPTKLTLSGQNVTEWRDKSANAYVLTRRGTGNIVSGTRLINGKNSLLWNALGSLQADFAPINNAVDGKWTIFALVVSDYNSGLRMITSSADQQVGQFLRCGDLYLESIAFAPGATSSAMLGVPAVGTPFIVRSHQSGAGGNLTVAINGTAGTPIALGANNAYSPNAPLTVGSYGADSLPWVGLIAEVVMYSRALNASEIAQVEAYLKAKWGI